jgi:hypothetical protein
LLSNQSYFMGNIFGQQGYWYENNKWFRKYSDFFKVYW